MHPGSGIEKISSKADRGRGYQDSKKTSNKNAFSPSVNYLPIFFPHRREKASRAPGRLGSGREMGDRHAAVLYSVHT
jgi:hypothetical protein